MYVCKECGNVFDRPFRITECLEFFGQPCVREEFCSPCCKASYEQSQPCAICGEVICGDYIEMANGERICDSCYVRKTIFND